MAYGTILNQTPIISTNPNTVATNVSYDNSTTSSAISSNNVQGAIDNLVTYVDNKHPIDLPWKLIKSVVLGETSYDTITFPQNMQLLKIVYNEFYAQNNYSYDVDVAISKSSTSTSQGSFLFDKIATVPGSQSFNASTKTIQIYPIKYIWVSNGLAAWIDNTIDFFLSGVESRLRLEDALVFPDSDGINIDFYYI